MASRDLISALSPPQIFPCTAQTHTVTHTQSPAHTTHSLHTTYVCHIRIHDHITMCACARAHTHIPPPPEGSSSQRFSSQCSSTVCLGNHLPLHAVNHGHCHHHHRHRHHSTNVPHGEEHLRTHTAVPTDRDICLELPACPESCPGPSGLCLVASSECPGTFSFSPSKNLQ